MTCGSTGLIRVLIASLAVLISVDYTNTTLPCPLGAAFAQRACFVAFDLRGPVPGPGVFARLRQWLFSHSTGCHQLRRRHPHGRQRRAVLYRAARAPAARVPAHG